MSARFTAMNLRPQEKRLVGAVGMALFLLLNFWFIWPRFKDWGVVEQKMNRTRATLAQYQAEIGKKPIYEKRLRELQASGSEFLTDELQLTRLVQNRAIEAGLQVGRLQARPPTGASKTNQFFLEQPIVLQFTSDGKQLVDFLVNMAAENAMVRVRELDVKPDPAGHHLVGSVTLIANFQNKSPVLSAATAVPGAKTNAATPAKANAPAKSTAPVTTAKPPAAKTNSPGGTKPATNKTVAPKVSNPRGETARGRTNRPPAKPSPNSQ